ncbi:D-glycerate 3-kinase [Microcystis aeruginosa NIES-44]|uniref:D-glycerate 3-kinase n=1 Tax=Microcystis aeruginosa NIES-44 TaxID=449439 RepID=A0A0A1VXT3_MICAE|nr:D-glycerate 3-kinase [Microcystis aeruginosa NIES-44]
MPACKPFIFGQITLKNTLKKILSGINLLVWVANPRELLLNNSYEDFDDFTGINRQKSLN